MNVQELIDALMLIEDKTKKVGYCSETYMYTGDPDEVDELKEVKGYIMLE